MINPNQSTSENVLRRFKEASYERMRVDLKCSIELKLKEFGMTWDDIGASLSVPPNPLWSNYAKHILIEEEMTLERLNEVAHIFSCEPYIIFRPREPWTKT